MSNSILFQPDVDLYRYTSAKMSLLESGFGIYLTSSQIAHLRSLKSEISVDNAVRTIMTNYFDNYSDRERTRKPNKKKRA